MDINWVINFLSVLAQTLTWSTITGIGMLIQIIRYRGGFFQYKRRTNPPRVLTEGWNHSKVTLSEVSLHYVEAGNSEHPLMLFVHGFPEFWFTWRRQLRHFQSQYHVVAIDMRGYGDSDKPRGVSNYSITKLVDDIKEIIPALGHSSCNLIAHDWGGAVAWHVAMRYPELVDKLVIHNCPHPKAFQQFLQGGSWRQMLKSWYMYFFQAPFLPELMLRSRDLAFIDEMATKNPNAFGGEAVEAFKYTFSQQGALTGPINFYRAAMRGRVMDPSGGAFASPSSTPVQPPTLIIWGTNDVALQVEMAELSLEFCREAELKKVEGASHFVQNDQPEVCNRFIEEFLSRD